MEVVKISFIAVLLAYKFYDKKKWSVSFFAALTILIIQFLLYKFILPQFINLTFKGILTSWILGYAVLFGLVWLIASGKIKLFDKFQTKNAVKTAFATIVIKAIIDFILLTLLTAAIFASVTAYLGLQSVL